VHFLPVIGIILQLPGFSATLSQMIVEGSAQWQQILFIIAGIFLLREIWSGWQLGAVRGLLRLTALFCAWIGGSMAAGATGTFLAFFSRVPPLFAPAVAALTVGIGIYVGISFLSGLLFKRTEHHDGVVRLGFGLGGAIFGIIFGLLLLWAGITLIRGLGALGEFRVVQARSEGLVPQQERAALFLMKLKASLELGVTGKRLSGADPLPAIYYDNIVKTSMVIGNPDALNRFLQYPPTQKILTNPRMAAVVQDPAVERIMDSRNVFPLVQNKQVQAAFSDTQLQEEFKAFPLTAALDFALTPALAPRPVLPHRKFRVHSSPNSLPGTIHATNSPLPKTTAP